MPKRPLSAVTKPAFQAHTEWASKPATSMLLIRHGETDWNVKRIIQGWKGTGLNALGLRQAKLAAARVKALPVKLDAVISSDLKRTRQTAQALVQATSARLVLMEEWRERNFGDWEAKSIEQLLAKFALGGKARADPFLSYDPHGGETMKTFSRRTEKALRRLETEFEGKFVAVVTHGGPMRIAACLATGVPTTKYFLYGRPGNAALTLIRSQGGTRWLEFYNDTAHLGTLIRA